MYSRQLVILFVNENGTAEKVGINQTNPQNIESTFVLVSYKLIKPYLSGFECIKALGYASTDEDLSAVNTPTQFVSSLCKI